MRWAWGITGIALLALACGDMDSGDGKVDDDGNAAGGSDQASSGGSPSMNDPAPSGADITTVAFEIDYAPGAEPYVAGSVSNKDPFEVSDVNLGRLFEGKELVLPRTLEEMESLSGVPEGPYTIETILDLAEGHRQQMSTPTRASYYVIWLDGYYFDADANAESRTVLGVSIGGTSVIAMFKPVIRSAEGGLLVNKAPYIEQTTFIHELGHAAGLVNNGFSMVTPHQDEEHGAHCDNPDCVMYYLNEGIDSMSQFVSLIRDDEIPILFDDHCLADVDRAGAE